MAGNSGKRALPQLPHPQHLRKQAKARLAMMKANAPSARLADAQHVLAREYGFENWAALQAEVARRTSGPLGQRAHVRRVHVAPLYPERYRQDGLIDQEADIETTAAFFRTGVAAQIGFLFTALIGVSLLFLSREQIHAADAVLQRLALLAHTIL
ncbi:MAG TPA: hypothetical protein VHV26_01175 [Rhizomicrobium sp.]|jgi:hypothetical protein|nr:hypothetical protein [Rhizomicrobium sp.]